MRDGGAGPGRPHDAEGLARDPVPCRRRGRAGKLRPRAVRGLPRHRRCREDSTTETFAALRLDIENWRWAGVPFFIRAGKRLPVTQTEPGSCSSIHPSSASGSWTAGRGEPGRRAARPLDRIRLTVEAHRADSEGPALVDLDLEFAKEAAAEDPRPTRCSCTPRWWATARGSPARTGSRKPGACSSRCWTPHRVHPYAQGSWGPEAANDLVRGFGTWHEPWMSTSGPDVQRSDGQSAAMPSPFPPIAEYAFLSDCHGGVDRAGRSDRLALRPEVRLAEHLRGLLDRQAGTFRFGPYGINVPSEIAYEPGTNVLATTWKTTGWVKVRDALTIGTRQGDDAVTPPAPTGRR